MLGYWFLTNVAGILVLSLVLPSVYLTVRFVRRIVALKYWNWREKVSGDGPLCSLALVDHAVLLLFGWRAIGGGPTVQETSTEAGFGAALFGDDGAGGGGDSDGGGAV